MTNHRGLNVDESSRLPYLMGLVEPVSLLAFRRDHLERAPLHVNRSDPAKFASLGSLAEIDSVLWKQERDLRSFVSLFRDNQEVLPNRIVVGTYYREWIADEFRRGSTLVLRNLERFIQAVAELHHNLVQEIKGEVTVNGYLTPPGSAGFSAHYDAHDVLILQLFGEKRWSLFGPGPVELPLRRPPAQPDARPLTPTELTLKAGDTLYIPRGHIHCARTIEHHSFHLTVGIRPCLWLDLLKAYVDLMAEDDLQLRTSILSADHLDPNALLLRLMSDQRSPNFLIPQLLASIDARLISKLSAVPSAGRSRFGPAVRVDGDTKVSRIPGAVSVVTIADNTASITFPGQGTEENPGGLRAPLAAAGALSFISTHPESFLVRDLPGPLSLASKCTLVNQLLEMGLLRPEGG